MNNQGNKKEVANQVERGKIKNIQTKMKEAQRLWNRDKRHFIDKNNGTIEIYKKTSTSWFYHLKDTNDVYYIFHRFWNVNKKKSECIYEQCNAKKDAEILFNETKNPKKDGTWTSVDSKIAQAHAFIQRYHEGKNTFYYYPVKQISFMFALAEVTENESSSKETKRLRRSLSRLFIDLNFKCNERQYPKILREMFIRIAKNTGKHGFITIGTYKRKSAIVINMIKSISLYATYRKLAAHLTIGEKLAEDVLREKLYNEEKATGTIVLSEHFKYIEIDHLRQILDYAWKADPAIYNYIILGLTSGLRPEELRRLISNPKQYLTEDVFFDYRSGKLVQKTKNKIDMSKLVNPAVSIVARLIIFHDVVKYDHNFFKNKYGQFRNDIPKLKNYVERCLRTTCATMMAYCENIEGIGKSSLRDAQHKLGHATLTMIISVYAPTPPSTLSPVIYFGGWGGEVYIANDGFEILLTGHTNLWDAWLLNDYLKRNITNNSSSSKKNICKVQKLKMNTIKEAQAFNAVTSGEGIRIKSSTY